MRVWLLAAALIVAGVASLIASALLLEEEQIIPASAAGVAVLLAGLVLIAGRVLRKPRTRDQEDVVQKAERDPSLAIRNPVTGLLAQWYLEFRLDEEVARARRYGLPLVVLTLEGSSQKVPKETRSSGLGESEVVRALTSAVRRTDLLASMGGSQFAICLLHCNRAGALPVIRRLMNALDDADWRIGIAVYPDDDYAGRDLISVANSRLAPWQARPPSLKLAA